MARKAPTVPTLRALFARSSNVCAFRGCTQEIVADDNLYVGEICHIEAASPNGPRFDPESSDEVRRSAENLMLLCHAHHRRVDADVETYTVESLRHMKAEHEASGSSDLFKVDASVIFQVEREVETYWTQLVEKQGEHPVRDLAVRIDADADGIELFRALTEQVQHVGDLLKRYRLSDESLPDELSVFAETLGFDRESLEAIPYYENPFKQRNWELHNLASPNVLKDLRVLILQSELHYLAEHLKLNQDDSRAQSRMEEVKGELEKIAESDVYHD